MTVMRSQRRRCAGAGAGADAAGTARASGRSAGG